MKDDYNDVTAPRTVLTRQRSATMQLACHAFGAVVLRTARSRTGIKSDVMTTCYSAAVCFLHGFLQRGTAVQTDALCALCVCAFSAIPKVI